MKCALVEPLLTSRAGFARLSTLPAYIVANHNVERHKGETLNSPSLMSGLSSWPGTRSAQNVPVSAACGLGFRAEKGNG
jgi:hypothetical protein